MRRNYLPCALESPAPHEMEMREESKCLELAYRIGIIIGCMERRCDRLPRLMEKIHQRIEEATANIDRYLNKK